MIWNITDGRLIRNLTSSYGDFSYLSVLKDGSLITSNLNADILIWDTNNGNLLRKLNRTSYDMSIIDAQNLQNEIVYLHLLKDDTLVVGKRDDIFHSLYIIDPYNSTRLRKIFGDFHPFYELNNGNIASEFVSLGYNIAISNLTNHHMNDLIELFGHSNDITSFVHISDKILASSSLDNTVKIWNIDIQNNCKLKFI